MQDFVSVYVYVYIYIYNTNSGEWFSNLIFPSTPQPLLSLVGSEIFSISSHPVISKPVGDS